MSLPPLTDAVGRGFTDRVLVHLARRAAAGDLWARVADLVVGADSPKCSQRLRYLVRAGYVETRPDPDAPNRNQYRITPPGRRRVQSQL